MVKAYTYLCRQCCCIDGFGEFGEFSFCYFHVSACQLSLMQLSYWGITRPPIHYKLTMHMQSQSGCDVAHETNYNKAF